MVAGWVKRKVKNSDKWVRRWLEISKYVLYSYQACPAEVPQARVMNTLDLRKTKEIKLQPDESMPGLFVIVPETSDDSHPGYVMRAENDAMAQVWVQGLRKAREDELAALAVTRNHFSGGNNGTGRTKESTCCMCCGAPTKKAESSALIPQSA
eukprot:CAMPEP_0197287428 /NCGR_PEP_ID=MMETSP0890-20130614/3751_1 /TAXON_ID=44058 ORGANISM="Aureoumbra lagunensis, Strain CCMP1510" /NCGR_SAMPLE_ID=MMETSP0890 /ASSEMBLY_ACC=CAM_ASM_000533 /LENGTH=152 /DNA_ID=CAMNT_0042757037 /DNA_START=36 /DNA_END=494 /DNA_ORIENTATION=-